MKANKRDTGILAVLKTEGNICKIFGQISTCSEICILILTKRYMDEIFHILSHQKTQTMT